MSLPLNADHAAATLAADAAHERLKVLPMRAG
jgi:hypothetical protein